MHHYAIGVLCSIVMLAVPPRGQKPTVEPIHVAAGTVLTFHLQTRLHPAHKNGTDTLPRGTEIRVKILDSIDSSVDRDGAEFHGVLVVPIVSGYQVIVHAESEVRGMLVLLRSRNHPDGFRYELLVTAMKDDGKPLELTASLNPSVFDGTTATESASVSETATDTPTTNAPPARKLPQPAPN
jgi:hypothetical protein